MNIKYDLLAQFDGASLVGYEIKSPWHILFLEDCSTPWLQIFLAVLASVATRAPHLIPAFQTGPTNYVLVILTTLIIQKELLGNGE